MAVMIFHTWQFAVVALARWLNRQQQDVVWSGTVYARSTFPARVSEARTARNGKPSGTLGGEAACGEFER